MKRPTMKIATTLQIALLLTGALRAQDGLTTSVSAHMDIYRAGGYDDGSDGTAPAKFTFPAAPGQTLTFSSITGAWSCGVSSLYGPDGSTTTVCQPHNMNNPIGTFSGYDTTDFTGGLAGIFLEDGLPHSAPPPLRFYVSDAAAGGIQTNFTSLSPQIGQVFFIGDGLTGTGSGATQMFAVPPTATRLYLGYLDSCSNSVPGCYSNNLGSLTATVNVQIRGLCNTGQTGANALGCTEVLVAPNPHGGGLHVDGNWAIAYPYPLPFEGFNGPCKLQEFEPAWVDAPWINWLPDSYSTVSEWITANDDSNVNTVSILLGNGDGTFKAPVPYPVGPTPQFVTVADIFGDGRLDVLTANSSNTVSILRGKGDCTFEPAESVSVGGNPICLAVADFNGDGKTDLAVASHNSDDISVLLGNGDGTFQPAQVYSLLGTLQFVVTADFNGDGLPDLAVVNQSYNGATILQNIGGGMFEIGASYAVGSGPVSMAVGDVNGDKKPDLMVANYNSETVSVLLDKSQ
jgi:VCBS repeat protein/FG-GAP repeat protein